MIKNKIKEYGINILLILLSVSIVLVLTEVYLRYNSLTIHDEQLGHRLKPNSVRVRDNIIYKINSDGLRDREIGEKDNNTFRIVILGDSFTFGFRNKLEDTYVKLLERKLDLYNPNINFEVVNAGVSGYGTYQELYFFDRIKDKYDPDLVLLQFYPSDFYDNLYYNPDDSKNHFFKLKLLYLLISLKTKIGNVDDPMPLIDRSPRNVLDKYFSKDSFSWIITEKAILYLEKKVKLLNSSFALVNIPNWWQFYSNYTIAKDKTFLTPALKDFIKEDMHNLIKYGDMDRTNKLLESFSEEHSIVLIDPSPEFKKSALSNNSSLYLLPVDDHLNLKGNRVVAEFIYHELIKNQLVPLRE